MRQRILIFLLCVYTSALAYAVPLPDLPEYQIVQNYRKLIILGTEQDGSSEQQQQLAAIIGKIIFHENLHQLNELEENIFRELTLAKRKPISSKQFLAVLSDDERLWDADKLAFLGMLQSLLERLEEQPVNNEEKQRIIRRLHKDSLTLERIQKRYDQELGAIFSKFSTRAIQDRRQAWNKYIKHLAKSLNKKTILDEYADTRLMPSSRSGKDKKKKVKEVFGTRLPKKTLVLTFDDGPHPRYSKKIVEILKKYDIQPIFFHVGKNLGKVTDKGEVKLSRTAKVSKQLLASGAILANHSYSHQILPKLSDEQVEQEISQTNSLIKEISGADTIMFRAPYGARNEGVLAQIKSLNLHSIMWNIDSKDWADPVPTSIAKRVVDEVEKYKKGIILFHDIQKQTVEALPLVLDELAAREYKFARWDGSGFVVDKENKLSVSTQGKPSQLYRESWAVLIGIDNYKHWPKLSYAVNDARGIKKMLIGKFGFKEENIFALFDEDATRDNILSIFHDKLGDNRSIKKNDRVFVFYAGHGATRQLYSGRELGYIIPVNAPARHYFGKSISMTNIGDISEALPVKHLLFVMDSCYSGLALTRGAARTTSLNFIQENSRRIARQMLTAGGADQEVADGGPQGHSVFTWSLMQALEQGKGDLNKDGYITASELAAHITPAVSAISLQTPAFGNLLGSQGGDFVFELQGGPQHLNSLSEQLDEQEAQLTRKLDALKREIEEKRARNLKLKQELQKMQVELAKANGKPVAKNNDVPASPRQLNTEGLRLYRNKDYQGSLQKFLQAANEDPAYVEAVNNAGFIYDKLGEHKKAIEWLEKTVALDRKRAVAWLNLADSYYALHDYASAEPAYRFYLKLKPKSKVREEVLQKLSVMAKGRK